MATSIHSEHDYKAKGGAYRRCKVCDKEWRNVEKYGLHCRKPAVAAASKPATRPRNTRQVVSWSYRPQTRRCETCRSVLIFVQKTGIFWCRECMG